MTITPSPIDRLRMATAQLRHAYMLLVNGHVTDTRKFARGLVGPQIELLEELAGSPEGGLRMSHEQVAYSMLVVLVVEGVAMPDVAHEVCFYVGGVRIPTGIRGATAEAAVERLATCLRMLNEDVRLK